LGFGLLASGLLLKLQGSVETWLAYLEGAFCTSSTIEDSNEISRIFKLRAGKPRAYVSKKQSRAG